MSLSTTVEAPKSDCDDVVTALRLGLSFFVGISSIFQKMKGSVTGKVVDWANGETMDQMLDQFSPMDYTGLSLIIPLESLITVI